ncbi:hypothetical protein SLEP1_g11624 [Rubroshorea leprosula]|nr:hypothetical protein SLEP1_g11624 [Rubroshorea leprosula]
MVQESKGKGGRRDNDPPASGSSTTPSVAMPQNDGVGNPSAGLILEFIAESLATPEGDKVRAARLMLTRQASMWWTDYRRTHPDDPKITTWEGFKDLFLEEYILDSMRREMQL